MDRVGTAFERHAEDVVNAEIGRHRAKARANAVGLIRFETVQAEFVFFGKHCHRAFAQLVGGTQDADGDLAAIGDQDFGEFGHGRAFGLIAANLACGGAGFNGSAACGADIFEMKKWVRAGDFVPRRAV